MNIEVSDVVFVIEKSRTFKRYLQELMESYVTPAISMFTGGIDEDNDVYFVQCALARFAIVFFGSELSLLNSNARIETMGPTVLQRDLTKAINNANYNERNGSRQAYIMEGLEAAANVFKDFSATSCNENVKRCLILITQSAPMLHPWCASSETIIQGLKMMGVKTSVISPHKIAELYKLFENTGGDLPTMTHKNYATKPQHLVLLNGFSLQERALSPSLGNSNVVNAVPNTNNFHAHSTSSPTHVGSPMTNQNPQNDSFGYQNQQNQPGIPRQGQPNPMMPQNNMNGINPMQQTRPKWSMGANQMGQQQPQPMGMQPNQMQNANGSMGQVSNMQQVNMMNNTGVMNQGQNRPSSQPIWQGHLEWSEKKNGPTGGSNLLRLPCKITSLNGKSEIKTDGWPSTLHMFLVRKELLGAVGSTHFANNDKVMFLFDSCPALDSLTNSLTNGQAGCVQLSSATTDVKIIALLYSNEKKAFLGFIPLDQAAFVAKINQVFQSQNKPRIPNVSNMSIHSGNFKQNVGNNMIQTMNSNQNIQNPNMQIMQNQGMNVGQPNLMVNNQMNQQMTSGMNQSNNMANSNVNSVGNSQMNQMGGIGQNQSMNMGPGNGQIGMGGHVNQGPMGNQSVLGNQLMRPNIGMAQQPNDQLNVRQNLQHQGNIRQMQRPTMQMNMNQPRLLQSQMQNQGLRQILHQRLQHQQQQQQQQQQMLMMQQQQGMRPQMGQGQQIMNQQNMGQQNMGNQIQDDSSDYLSMLS